MKRYIKAAYDPSMPMWLRVKSDINQTAIATLNDNYAMAQAKFYENPQPDSEPIYLLYDVYEEDYGWNGLYKKEVEELAYLPNYEYKFENYWISAGTKYRRLSTAAKSKIKEHIADVVYMVAPKLQSVQEGRDYVDPRYSRTHRKWGYAGQYPGYLTTWNSETHRSERVGIDRWYTNTGRDKSGYYIPKPEELYEKLYARFPDKVNNSINKVKAILDTYYDKLDAAKNKVFSQYDIRKGRVVEVGNYNGAMQYLNYAIKNYGAMYQIFENILSDPENIDHKRLSEFMNGTGYDDLPYTTKSIDEKLERIDEELESIDKMFR